MNNNKKPDTWMMILLGGCLDPHAAFLVGRRLVDERLSLVAALMVVIQRNPVVSALYLVLTFVSLGGMYVLLHAPFIAAVQVVATATLA